LIADVLEKLVEGHRGLVRDAVGPWKGFAEPSENFARHVARPSERLAAEMRAAYDDLCGQDEQHGLIRIDAFQKKPIRRATTQ
jgi:hypothetical protein